MDHLQVTKKTLPNDVVIAEVARLLQTQPAVILPVRGNSMLPFIIGDLESVELVLPTKAPLRIGDVVLAWVQPTTTLHLPPSEAPHLYVVHRVIAIDGDRLTLMGDGNTCGQEACRVSDVVALATHVIDRHEHRHDLYTPRRQWAVRRWWQLLPVRRWILGVYKRTWLKILKKKRRENSF
jgi:hypothetical protein